MTWEDLHAEEAPAVGDDDLTVQEAAGVAPPCEVCGRREAVERDRCAECLEE